MLSTVEDQLGLPLFATGRSHGTVAGRRRGSVTGEAADTGVLADRRGSPAVGDGLRAQRQLQVSLAWTRGRFLVHRKHVRQHGGRLTRCARDYGSRG